ncbi:MAG: hypothetical protein ACFB5Z_01220 [Elainellaceae cyanobacterium]
MSARQIADREAETFGCSSTVAASPDGSQLPDAVLGTFDTTQAKCSEPGTSMSEVVIDPDRLDFYSGYATVNAVTPQGVGYAIDATFYQQEGAVEVRPEPAEFRIEPTEGGVRLERMAE